MGWPALSFLLLLSAGRTIAKPTGTTDWLAYERGELGSYPQVTFRSSDAYAPLVHVETWSHECDTDSYTLLTPHGEAIGGNKAFLLDSKGELVWYTQERGAINTFQVQSYRGNDYLTMWVGDKDYFGHGHGYYKMFDQSYTLAYTISAGNDIDGDYHDFSITKDDTALVTSYVKIPWDLKHLGRQSGFIWDCRFQEIDVETNSVLFEWKASDHFVFTDMNVDSWRSWTGTDDDPWDWIHMNGVEKDQLGNFLISTRYTNAVSYIDGKTGEFVWHLGGLNNSFIDLAEGSVTQFIDPHMARWTDANSTISLFDNISFRSRDSPHHQSHGVHIQINVEKGVAKLIADYVHPTWVLAESEGSMHLLENGNSFVGYGSASRYSEFSPDGRLLCNTHYSPLDTGAGDEPRSAYVGSYRVYKQRWEGHPKRSPDVKIEGGAFHVSWNGATEVRSWRLDGRGVLGKSVDSWKSIGTFAKTGFETTIDLAGVSASSYQLMALAKNGTALRAWNVHPDGDLWELFHDVPDTAYSERIGLTLVIVCVALLLYTNRRYLLGPRKTHVSLSHTSEP